MDSTLDRRLVVPAYEGNRLIARLPPIPSRDDIAKHLTYKPSLPPAWVRDVPFHIRLHQMAEVRKLHIPTRAEINLHESIDLMLRQGLTTRQPEDPEVWEYIYNKPRALDEGLAPIQGAFLGGISGTGKTVATERALSYYPRTVMHESFPHLTSPFKHMVHLKVDAPASGKAFDLADILGKATDALLGEGEFADRWGSKRQRGLPMLMEWLQFAKTHFLGLLTIDEIQNLFTIPPLAQRRAVQQKRDRLELRIADDETLKFLLTLMNTARIPLLAEGTPDGMAALATRLSTAQRLITGGSHRFVHSATEGDPYYSDDVFPTLWKYQWFENTSEKDSVRYRELRQAVNERGGGVPRIYTCLWCFAHRCGFERLGTTLEVQDVHRAMDTYLAPLRPAVTALRSNDPDKLSMYEDLLPRDDALWASLTGN